MTRLPIIIGSVLILLLMVIGNGRDPTVKPIPMDQQIVAAVSDANTDYMAPSQNLVARIELECGPKISMIRHDASLAMQTGDSRRTAPINIWNVCLNGITSTGHTFYLEAPLSGDTRIGEIYAISFATSPENTT